MSNVRAKVRKQCRSCPFLDRNFEEFNEVAKKLSAKAGQPEPDFFQCLTIRKRVVDDAKESGKLSCHETVYDTKMNLRSGRKPCIGLALYKDGKKS